MNKSRKLVSVVLALVLAVSLMPAAFAEESTVGGDFLEKKGSVTIGLLDKKTKSPINGASVTLYRVGMGRVEKSNLYFDLIGELAGTVNADNKPVTLDGLKADENVANAAALQTAIGKLSADDAAKVETQTGKTGSDGNAVFSDMSVGVYLVVCSANNYEAVTPYLLYLPYTETVTDDDGTVVSSKWVFDVKANPKAEEVPSYDPPDPPNPPTPPDNPPENPPENPPTNPPGGDELVEIPDDEPPLTLPQTGLLQWPVPVMAMAGAVLFVLGFASERKRKSEQ